jgi:hypothetical protein
MALHAGGRRCHSRRPHRHVEEVQPKLFRDQLQCTLMHMPLLCTPHRLCNYQAWLQVTANSPIGVTYNAEVADTTRLASTSGGLSSTHDLCDGVPDRRVQRTSSRSDKEGFGGRGPVGNARRKSKTGRWSDATLKSAMAAVEAGGHVKTVARYFDIPPSSLSDHLYGKTLGRKRGPPTVLHKDEENALTAYMGKMQDYGHLLTMQQLRLKVATITQERVTPFHEGIPGRSWVRWFKLRHPDLTLRSSQGLEFARARGLCPENVASFYGNLHHLYNTHKYPATNIWNCDESGAQTSRNGGGLVWARKGSQTVHSLMPNEREWVTILSCINASGYSIPGFYIFRGKRMMENYIEHCEDGASMAMQPEGWMTALLFSQWISHFIKALESRGGVSPTTRHLLIVDGHNSHVTLEVVQKAMEVGLDLLTLPSHTSHCLQPLDVSIFGPFKRAFKRCRDRWTLQNIGRGASKAVLAQWVSSALEKALTENNIRSGFWAIGIWPLNKDVVNQYMLPSVQFVPANHSEDEEGDDSSMEEEDQGTNDHAGEIEMGVHTYTSQPIREQYFVGSFEPNLPSGSAGFEPSNSDSNQNQSHENVSQPSIHRFLQLPQVAVQGRQRRTREEPLVDYSKSIMLTSEQYLQSMELKAERKEKARREAEVRKLEAEKRKESRAAEKLQKEAEKAQREVDARNREAFKQKWRTNAIRQAGEQLQWLLKNAAPLLPGAYQPPFYGILPQICKTNMARRLAKRRATKYGIGSVQDVPVSIAPAWVHRCDPRYMADVLANNAQDAPAVCNNAVATVTAPNGTHGSLLQCRNTNLGGRQARAEVAAMSPYPGLATGPEAQGHALHGGPSAVEQLSAVPAGLENPNDTLVDAPLQ